MARTQQDPRQSPAVCWNQWVRCDASPRPGHYVKVADARHARQACACVQSLRRIHPRSRPHETVAPLPSTAHARQHRIAGRRSRAAAAAVATRTAAPAPTPVPKARASSSCSTSRATGICSTTCCRQRSNLADFASAESLLDHLTATARAQGKDRYFSYLTTPGRGELAARRGPVHRLRPPHPHRPGEPPDDHSRSSKAARRPRRACSAATRSSPWTRAAASCRCRSCSPTARPRSATLLGPAEAGVRRGLRLLRNGATREVSIVKRTVTIDPVLERLRHAGAAAGRHAGRGLPEPAQLHRHRGRAAARRVRRGSARSASATSSSTCATTAAGW